MNHITTRLMPFLFLLFIGVGKAYCDTTNPYLSTTGGTYKLMESLDDYNQNNIIIIASYTTSPSNVVIMTTSATESGYSGNFASYTYDSYNTEMPNTISLNAVNTSINNDDKEPFYPYEYQAVYKKDNRTGSVPNWQIYLKNINNKYFTSTSSSVSTLTLSSTQENIRIEKYEDLPNIFVEQNSKRVRCTSDGYFYCYGTAYNGTKPSYIYKKVHALSIGSTGYATLYYGNHDLIVPSSPEGLEAYTYRLNENKLETSHTFKAGDIIPAGTAVVCKGTPNTTYYLDIIANATKASTLITDENYSNLLLGTNTDSITKGTNCRFFYLTDGSTGFGFRYRATGGGTFNNEAHKAYLCIPESAYTSGSAKAIEFLLPQEGDVTSVQATEATTAPLHNECYDLSGKRIKEPDKGTFIKQGKKFLKQ